MESSTVLCIDDHPLKSIRHLFLKWRCQADALIERLQESAQTISPRKRARVQENLILDCFRKTGAMPTCHY